MLNLQGKNGCDQTALDASGRPRRDADFFAGYGPDDAYVPAGPGYSPYPPPGSCTRRDLATAPALI